MICYKIYWNIKILKKKKKCYEKKWINCEKIKRTPKPDATQPNPKRDVAYTKQQAIRRKALHGGTNTA